MQRRSTSADVLETYKREAGNRKRLEEPRAGKQSSLKSSDENESTSVWARSRKRRCSQALML
jgi:hypothetical protein